METGGALDIAGDEANPGRQERILVRKYCPFQGSRPLHCTDVCGLDMALKIRMGRQTVWIKTARDFRASDERRPGGYAPHGMFALGLGCVKTILRGGRAQD